MRTLLSNQAEISETVVNVETMEATNSGCTTMLTADSTGRRSHLPIIVDGVSSPSPTKLSPGRKESSLCNYHHQVQSGNIFKPSSSKHCSSGSSSSYSGSYHQKSFSLPLPLPGTATSVWADKILPSLTPPPILTPPPPLRTTPLNVTNQTVGGVINVLKTKKTVRFAFGEPEKQSKKEHDIETDIPICVPEDNCNGYPACEELDDYSYHSPEIEANSSLLQTPEENCKLMPLDKMNTDKS